MIFAGSKGKTAEQIATVIGKNKTEKESVEYYSEFVKRHASIEVEDVVSKIPRNRKRAHSSSAASAATETRNVNVANGFFIDHKIDLVPSYEKLVMEEFDGKIQSINFDKSAAAVKEINKFVAEKTNKMIKKIITSEEISSQTSVILINAIHFIGFWEKPFKNRKTHAFNSNPSRIIPMMSKELKAKEDDWNFQRGDGWACLGIPYKSRKAWLYIVLPYEENGLDSLIKKFDLSLVEKCTERRKTGKMEIIISIISISSTIDLEKHLKALGIEDVFSDRADLTGMLKGTHRIEKAIHKAVIKIDEKGTEASAVTKTVMVARSGQHYFMQPIHFCI
uniref:Serpin domain-containing protein n=1 Tax=Panagrolaimus sp. ES5 TaxID=591445 RepID=A0AC34G4Z5_9BILA